MPEYLLPCSCGQKTAVSTAQAGQAIRCACGAEMQVPTLRGLWALEVAEAAGGDKRGPVWENRHRAAFVFVLGSLVCLGVAAYLWATLPARPTVPTAKEVSDTLDNSPMAQALQTYSDMQQGLGQSLAAHPDAQTRRQMTWGIGAALAIAAALAGAAWAVLNRPGRRVAPIKTQAAKPSDENKEHKIQAP
jgi:hypothetical protein